MKISIERNESPVKWGWASTGPLGYRIPDAAWWWAGPVVIFWRRGWQ